MLKMASCGSPNHHYNGGELSDMDNQHLEQNGFQEDFPSSLQESTSNTNGMEASAQADDPISVPAMTFLSSPQELGYGIKATENGALLSEPLNVPQRYDPKDELFRPSSLRLNGTANGGFHDLVQTQKFSKRIQRNGSDVVTDDVDALFGSSNKGKDLIRSPQAVVPNPFYKTLASDADLFSRNGEELFHVNNTQDDAPSTGINKSFKEGFDIFSSPANPVDPFPRQLPRNLFNDPFGPTPSKTMSSTPLTNLPSEFKLDTPASTGLVKKTLPKVPPVVPPKPQIKPRNFLMTPQGSKEEFLEPTSFSQASSLSSSASISPADMIHVQTFKRPPRPVPRARRPNAEKPPAPERPPPPAHTTELEPEVPEAHTAEPEPPKPPRKPVLKPLPKPLFPHKPKKPESKPLEPENFVFEDILLIGQEHCVEDWPEDSPELDPDFKPSGTFKLRRESMKAKNESDGGSSEDPDSTFGHPKKKDKKLRMSLLSRRSSKDKYSDDAMEGKSNMLASRRKTPKEFGSNDYISTGDDEDNYSLDYKKKSTKTKVSHLFRRASDASSTYNDKRMNEYPHSKDGGHKKSSKRNNTIDRRKSADSVLDEKDYEDGEKGGHRQRRNSKLEVKFVPQRGFAISLKKPHDEPKGAHGYTAHRSSKDLFAEDFGAHGYTPRDKLQDEDFGEMEALSLHSTRAAIMDDELQKPHRYSPSLRGDDDVELSKERKQKKSKHKMNLPHKSKASYGLKEKGSTDDEMTEKYMKSYKEEYDEDPDEIEMLKLKKPFKLKVSKKHKHKSKKNQSEAPSAEHLSEAAVAAWEAAQMDEQAVAGEEEDEEEDGDTDSLLEWWYTVEKWDELPSDEEDAAIKEDESKSFTLLADKVERGLRLFNKVFTEQAEVLWESIISLHSLADDINEFHHKAKIAGISGGTTTAVGTVAAITGLALAPVTFGASLIVTAVGVGVATAGGITSASAAISDNVNNKNDRKKIESLLQEYEERMLEISNILHFINKGLCKLRGHPFLRSGTQHYSKDWEIRKAVQMISIVDSPVMRATEVTDDAVGSLQGLFKGMDKYFIKETRELKKGYKKEIVAVIRQVANVLNDCIMELNTIRENLLEATGQM